MDDAPIVVSKAYDFNLWLVQKVQKFPRHFRTTLGDRLASSSIDLLLLLLDAAYTSQKESTLIAANRKLNAIRYLLRMAKDLRLMSIESFGFAVEKIDEIGRMAGGWRKSVARPT